MLGTFIDLYDRAKGTEIVTKDNIQFQHTGKTVQMFDRLQQTHSVVLKEKLGEISQNIGVNPANLQNKWSRGVS